MKRCELCMSAATTYCESDQACLCWHCDAKVHGANFLVARHVRCLLCHACQSRTPWRATGFMLGRAVSVCETCVKGADQEESQAENEDDDQYANSIHDDENEADNHVLSRRTASSSSSSVDSSCTEPEFSKRSRANASNRRYQVDLDCLSAKQTHGHSRLEQEADSIDSVPV